MYRFTGFTEKANNAMNLRHRHRQRSWATITSAVSTCYIGLIAKRAAALRSTVLNKLGITAERLRTPDAGEDRHVGSRRSLTTA